MPKNSSKDDNENHSSVAATAESLVIEQDFMSFKRQLSDLLVCGICLDTIKDPHSLDCGHSYCGECLLSWFAQSKICPSCNTPAPRQPVANHTIHNIVSLIKDQHDVKRLAKDAWQSIYASRPLHEFIFDSDDDVARCATCHWELNADLTCDRCELRYWRGPNGIDYRPEEESEEEEGEGEDDEHEEDQDLSDFVVSDDQSIEFETDDDNGSHFGDSLVSSERPFYDINSAFVDDEASEDESGSESENEEEEEPRYFNVGARSRLNKRVVISDSSDDEEEERDNSDSNDSSDDEEREDKNRSVTSDGSQEQEERDNLVISDSSSDGGVNRDHSVILLSDDQQSDTDETSNSTYPDYVEMARSDDDDTYHTAHTAHIRRTNSGSSSSSSSSSSSDSSSTEDDDEPDYNFSTPPSQSTSPPPRSISNSNNNNYSIDNNSISINTHTSNTTSNSSKKRKRKNTKHKQNKKHRR